MDSKIYWQLDKVKKNLHLTEMNYFYKQKHKQNQEWPQQLLFLLLLQSIAI